MNNPSTSTSVGACMRNLDIYLPLAAQNSLRKLLMRYMRPGRDYHNLQHIEEGLVDVVRCVTLGLTRDEQIVLFYAWLLHDIDKESEPKSARIFVKFANDQLQLDALSIHRGEKGILATAHKHKPRDIVAQLLCDIDLLRLACTWDDFQRHTASLRREKAHLSDAEFRAWQIEQLRWFLSHKSIYLTDLFCEHETQARANITRAMTELGVPP